MNGTNYQPKPAPTPSSIKKPASTPSSIKKPAPTPSSIKKPTPTPSSTKKPAPTPSSTKKPGNSTFFGTGLTVGDKVLVQANVGLERGILRYLGQTSFAPGIWAGVQLNQPLGKNDGSVAGRRYFHCPLNYGLFVRMNKVTKDMVKFNSLLPQKVRNPRNQTSSQTTRINGTPRKLKDEMPRKNFYCVTYRKTLKDKSDTAQSQGDSVNQQLIGKIDEMVQSESKEAASEIQRLNYNLKKLLKEILIFQIRHKEALNEFEDECKRLASRLIGKEKVKSEKDTDLLESISQDLAKHIVNWWLKLRLEKENLLEKIAQSGISLIANLASVTVERKTSITTPISSSSLIENKQLPQ